MPPDRASACAPRFPRSCIRSLAGEDGAPYLEPLHAIALGDNRRDAIAAITVLLDRGYGKVRQELEVDVRPDVRALSDQELEDRLLEFAAKVGRKRLDGDVST